MRPTCQVIKHPCCGKLIASCYVPECYTEKDWMKELPKYVKRGFLIDLLQPHEPMDFSSCTCNQQPEKDPRQFELSLTP